MCADVHIKRPLSSTHFSEASGLHTRFASLEALCSLLRSDQQSHNTKPHDSNGKDGRYTVLDLREASGLQLGNPQRSSCLITGRDQTRGKAYNVVLGCFQ